MRIAGPAHRAQIKGWPACGRAPHGPWPAAVTHAVPDGPTGPPGASYCPTQPPLPVARPTERVADGVPHRVREATGWKAAEPWARGMAPSTAAGPGLGRPAAGRQVEASGLRVTGTVPWRHGAGTERLTSDAGHAQRGPEAMPAAGRLGAFRGPAVHDHRKPYGQEDACHQALCHAPQRSARRWIDPPSQPTWAHDLAERLLAIHAAVAA